MARIFIVRHGETEWSRIGRHTGRSDLALTAEGERQARAVGERLRDRAFAEVATSPLRRARQTCALAGFGDGARVDPDLQEWDYGQWEGKTKDEVRRQVPGWTIFDGPVPGGEALEDVCARADRAIARLDAAAGDALVFAHGHLLRVLTLRWAGLDPRAGGRLALGPTRVGLLDHDEDGRRIIALWNAAGPDGA